MMSLTAIDFSATIASTPVVMNNELYFAASNGSSGTQLWESNGTASGTTMLTDVNPAYGGIDPTDLTAVGNTLYFVGDDSAGSQLWSSNGTSSGTQMVTDVDPGIGLVPSDLTDVNGTLYCVGYNPTDGYQLYTSNGTASGTVMVADIDGTAGSNPSDLTAVGNLVYFSATDGTHGYQLWVSNGTSNGTFMVDEIDGTAGSFPDELTAAGSSIYFAAFDSVHGYQLWVSNGTAGGTSMVTSANTSGGGLSPSDLTTAGGTLFFAGNDGTHGYQLWSSDGTSSDTAMVADINGDAGCDPSDLTAIGSTVYFSADNGTDNDQLWASNGTASGTTMVDDINGTAGSNPASLTDFGGTLYFSAYTSSAGTQVWQSNGTARGTTMDSDLNTPSGCSATNLVPATSDLYFTGTGGSMWQWQPSPAVTPTITWSNPANIVYGTALGDSQLDATASVPGTFTYTPATGTVLDAGDNQTLSVVFTPADANDYARVSSTAAINVDKVQPSFSQVTGSQSIAYGSSTIVSGHLAAMSQIPIDENVSITIGSASATAMVQAGGSFSATIDTSSLSASNAPFTITYTYAGDPNFQSAIDSSTTLTISKATPILDWFNPAGVTYGTPLSRAQLDATGSVPGTYTYTPDAGTILKAGAGQILSVSFTPTDTVDYEVTSATVTITVARAPVTLTVSAPSGSYDGAPFTATALIVSGTSDSSNTLTASLEDTTPILTYYDGTDIAGASLGTAPPTVPGTYTVLARFPGSTDYEPVNSAPSTFTINQGTASIAISTSARSAVYGQPITIVAKVTSAGTPGGSVTFSDGVTPLATVQLNNAGTATLITSGLAVGSDAIIAKYNGDADSFAAQSSSAFTSITPAITDIVFVPHPVLRKNKVVSLVLTAGVAAVAPGGGIPTGTVDFELQTKSRKKTNASVLATVALNGGEATLKVKPSRVRNQTMAIIYNGDPDDSASSLITPRLT
jgi:ELWxxDGT repeat protein